MPMVAGSDPMRSVRKARAAFGEHRPGVAEHSGKKGEEHEQGEQRREEEQDLKTAPRMLRSRWVRRSRTWSRVTLAAAGETRAMVSSPPETYEMDGAMGQYVWRTRRTKRSPMRLRPRVMKNSNKPTK